MKVMMCAETPLIPVLRRGGVYVAGVLTMAAGVSRAGAEPAANFHQKIEPLLSKYCYDCHGGGVSKGKVSFDTFASDGELIAKRDLWLAALKNVRAGLMPPREEDVARPTAAEIDTLSQWIKYEAFAIDSKNPDPGRLATRRLNRVEYRNTVRDLMGYDFNAEVEFPPDDSGNGFDNNGDVLTISPLHMEKYLAAAESIVEHAVPKVAKIMRERTATGKEFRGEGGVNGDNLNAKLAMTVSRNFTVDRADKYQLVIDLETRGSFDFDPSRCDVVGKIDGKEQFRETVAWSETKSRKRELEVDWAAGSHTIAFQIVPLAPVAGVDEAATASAEKARVRESRAGSTSVSVRILSVQVRGPLNPQHWLAPENYARFFPKGPAPAEAAARDAYATELLRAFATKAFRRPVDEAKVTQLLALARRVYAEPGKTFEEGVGRAMMAVLGSPRFIFRVEEPLAAKGEDFPLVDEYALASRLSYLLWSTMPDEELFGLAARGELRRQLRPQVTRMLADSKSQAFVRNFTGQWLQARDIESVPINMRVVMGPNAPKNRDGRVEFDGAFRRLMRSETEMFFEHLIKDDRSVLEIVDSNYAFLNERLATHYGVPGVTGENLRLVQLPANSPRGGMLTQGTVLAVTSNPTRTSPVKRGLFILDNILGTPPPPPPPNVPDLEEAKKEFKGREPKLSEMLALHRADKLCSSCHERMDPLGLALENFNALGGWRDTEAGQPIDPSGELITGEKFASVRELKRVLAQDRKLDVFRCVTEKLMTYALGRGLEYYDIETIDAITAQLASDGGRMSVLINGVIESAAFQKQRARVAVPGAVSFVPSPHLSPVESRP
ncbi:MAG: DUF1592 domain-containing protein [Opitutaceae bacterium]